MAWERVKGAGLVVYRRTNDNIEYLTLQASGRRKHWSVPKGHALSGETDLETAIRETEEETGITSKDLCIFKNSQKTLQYSRQKGKTKTIILFIAELLNNVDVQLSHEHINYQWATKNEACQLVQYDGFDTLLSEYHNCISDMDEVSFLELIS